MRVLSLLSLLLICIGCRTTRPPSPGDEEKLFFLEENERLRTELGKARQTIDRLRREHAAALEEKKRLYTEWTKLNSRNEMLFDENAALRERLEARGYQRERLRDATAELQARNRKLRKWLDRLMAESRDRSRSR